jgi:hypothetical protein
LTQVLDRPLTGRCFFEEVIRENLDIGRSDQMQLIFNRRVTRRTPGGFRTRVLTDGVVPSLHVQYKKSKVKQYHKEGQALRTETTINDTYDFAIGRALRNLPALREIETMPRSEYICRSWFPESVSIAISAPTPSRLGTSPSSWTTKRLPSVKSLRTNDGGSL